eukprot:CAMPEP_0171078184 /NCGR_PEP_ID=MMETSP0766_2-20121228/14487_1 /TAXON_ID=439317 /ORGANISM="Gambierdiscus australes, Strain CAWD 149" /LENGTH=459 /DNA_ID=CAMNT_0011535293 /DNA_START=27 /DNA_END=1406 /DNA_ORIENTATION=+
MSTLTPVMETPEGDPNPEKRAMPTFLQNMMSANPNIICTAKGDDVKKVAVADVFAHRLRIPIFQRRYCWCTEQWETLLKDALSVVDGVKDKHSLGRITCVKGDPNSGGRLAVVDGQQRNTTCSLLLAAIRDIAESRREEEVCRKLSADLDAVLLPDREGLAAWLRSCGGYARLEEGAALDFVALVPTYCDRAAYFAAVLPPHVTLEGESGEWKRPMEAKLFFQKRLQAESSSRLAELADVVLHKLEWLFFPLNLDEGHADGTEDLHIIFERLAARDATFCKPHRETEYASMGAADFVRNLLLGSFRKEQDAIDMYKQHWLPIEVAAAETAQEHHSSNAAVFMESMLEAFMKQQPQHLKGLKLPPSAGVGGQLYARFRRWLAKVLAADEAHAGESQSEANERRTAALLQKLQTFAVAHLEKAKQAPAPLQTSMAGGSSRLGSLGGRPAGLPGVGEAKRNG